MNTMIKHIVSVAVVAVVCGSNAFASRARVNVMGTADAANTLPAGTSIYIDDYRNMFYNPALVNTHKNWAAIEASNGSAATASEGGFSNSIASINYAVFMNRNGGVVGNYATAPTRPIDIIVGGDMGVKWGLGLTMAGNRVSETVESNEMVAKAGVEVAGVNIFAGFMLAGSDKQSATVTNKNGGMNFGATMKMGEWMPFLTYASTNATPQGGTSTTQNAGFNLGMGRNTKFDQVKFNYSVGISRIMRTGGAATNRNMIPINMSAETDVASWMAVRAGLGYNLWDRTNNVTNAGQATGSIGASFLFGKATTFDWAVGYAGGGIVSPANTGIDLANNFFSQASLNYRW
ncbi:MAG: hypothetical protein JNL01_13030 [Bdellovibrionales bacterium]|nr:hypothetical protein [Bdellovibrionales bacterium]